MATVCQGMCMNDGENRCECARRLVTSPQSDCAPIQSRRRDWKPVLPKTLLSPVTAQSDETVASPQVADAEALAQLFPQTWHQKFVKLTNSAEKTDFKSHEALNVGVVLSGGQAAGGHNVIAGIYDYVKQCNAASKLYGFKSGPHGIFTHNYVELTDAVIYKYRNMGGFDMICSGRHKIETEEQKKASLEICEKLGLHGLIIIGGDDSNTNGAILAEYFKANGCKTLVAGAPKTIDGDLKNEYIEISFGFDTAIKVYSELVGNLCVDARCNKDRYHFVRLMGRSATNIGLEVALQTRANLCFIGEEIQQNNRSLMSICQEVADMVEQRHAAGKDYGVVLLPEGLIEFIPEVGSLISEINDILGDGTVAFDESKLSANSSAVFKSLPSAIRGELLLERDSHGNVQVAKIATERLLILMTRAELDRRGYQGPFFPLDHYFGYEGRCAMPSNFDSNYCYALGHTAAALIDNKLTGYMAVVRNVDRPSAEWQPAGCPVTIMMNLERRKGKDVPVIKKYLVELDKAPFTTFKEIRERLKIEDLYRNPGPIQFTGPSADVTNYMVTPPTRAELLGEAEPTTAVGKARSAATVAEERVSAPTTLPAVLLQQNVTLKANGAEYFPDGGSLDLSGQQVAVVCVGASYPGAMNVLKAVTARVSAAGGRVVVCEGVRGLVEKKYWPADSQGANTNLGGFASCSSWSVRGNETAVTEACRAVDATIFLGDGEAFSDLAKLNLPQSVFVPMSSDNSVSAESVCCNIGFDTLSKTYASLVGNLLTDAASAHKYWYFVKVLGGTALSLEVASQTHANHCVIADEGKDIATVVKDIADVVYARGNAGRNFGCVLIPESLACSAEPLKSVLRENDSAARKAAAEAKLGNYPQAVRDAVTAQTHSGRVDLSNVPVDQLLAQLVGEELKTRSGWKGSFAPVTYYMGLQARSAMPSVFDCVLGECHGHLAALAAGLKHPSMMVTAVSNAATDSVDGWSMRVVNAATVTAYKNSYPASLLTSWRSYQSAYATSDLYCNPGPIQFDGPFSTAVSQSVIARKTSASSSASKHESTTTDISDAVVHA